MHYKDFLQLQSFQRITYFADKTIKYDHKILSQPSMWKVSCHGALNKTILEMNAVKILILKVDFNSKISNMKTSCEDARKIKWDVLMQQMAQSITKYQKLETAHSYQLQKTKL